jgi:hypothetical protein
MQRHGVHAIAQTGGPWAVVEYMAHTRTRQPRNTNSTKINIDRFRRGHSLWPRKPRFKPPFRAIPGALRSRTGSGWEKFQQLAEFMPILRRHGSLAPSKSAPGARWSDIALDRVSTMIGYDEWRVRVPPRSHFCEPRRGRGSEFRSVGVETDHQGYSDSGRGCLDGSALKLAVCSRPSVDPA